jgi:hypothetical protein
VTSKTLRVSLKGLAAKEKVPYSTGFVSPARLNPWVSASALCFAQRTDTSTFPYVLIDALRLTPAIRQYQLVQMAAEAFRVRYVADAVLDGGTQLRIRGEFQTILNTPVTIEFDRVLEFAGTRSAKFLQAISDFVVQNKS